MGSPTRRPPGGPRSSAFHAAVAVASLLAVAVIEANIDWRGCYHTPARACAANQKVIAGAVEMYNLDYNTSVTALDADFLTRALRDHGYLQSVPDDPGEGAGTAGHYALDNGEITCRAHGGIAAIRRRLEREARREEAVRQTAHSLLAILLGIAVYCLAVAAWGLVPASIAWAFRRQDAAAAREPLHCPACGECLARSGEETCSCPACGSPHHASCWALLGTCARVGCQSGLGRRARASRQREHDHAPHPRQLDVA